MTSVHKILAITLVTLTIVATSLGSYGLASAAKKLESKEGNQVKTIILVRHAEKRNDGSRDPALSQQGSVRAKVLTEALAELDLTQLIASNYQRTQLTLAPIALQRGLDIEIVQTKSGIKPHIAAIVALVNQEPGNSLIAGHSNTVPLIINALGGRLELINEDSYDELYRLSISKTGKVSLIKTHFGRPSID
ncbi:histidine phosphatase family protein [Shewanella sp. 125m-7]